MDIMVIALICAAVFGTVMVIAAFIRQLLLSRDKKLNDEAQSRALAQEILELEKIRTQLQNEKRFDIHYEMLGANKEAIKYIDQQIENVLQKKTKLVDRYVDIVLKESGSIIDKGEVSIVRKEACDKLKREIDNELDFYDKEIQKLQKRRDSLWDTHTDFQNSLLAQEKARNNSLDSLYKQHSAILEKVFIRHIAHSEIFAVKSIEASTVTFKDMVMAPIQFLMQFFGGRSNIPAISFAQTKVEHSHRVEVMQTEKDINEFKPEGASVRPRREPMATVHDEEDDAPAFTTTSVSLAL